MKRNIPAPHPEKAESPRLVQHIAKMCCTVLHKPLLPQKRE